MSDTWNDEDTTNGYDWNAYEDYMDDLYEYDGENDLDEFEVQCQREADEANGVWQVVEPDPWAYGLGEWAYCDPPF